MPRKRHIVNPVEVVPPRGDPFAEYRALEDERTKFGSGELASALDPHRLDLPEDFLSGGKPAVEGIKQRAAILRSAKIK